MGTGFSKSQVAHLHELREFTKSSIVVLKNGKKLPRPTKTELTVLLKYIYEHCPAYPEKGSIRTSTWIKLGTYLHESPRAPAKMLATWRIIVECLKIHEEPLTAEPGPPPAYQSDTKLPQLGESTTLVPSGPSQSPPEVPAPRAPLKGGAVASTLWDALQNGDLDLEDSSRVPPVNMKPDPANPAGPQIPVYTPVPYKAIKDIKEATAMYGITSPYTRGLIECLGNIYWLVLDDWKLLFLMILTHFQYAIWSSAYEIEIERQSAWGLPPGVTNGHLIGGVGFETPQQQAAVPWEASRIISRAANTALLKVDDPEDGPKKLFTKLYQGPSQNYQDFVDDLKKAIDRQVDNHEGRQLLLRILAYKNANYDCQCILQPLVDQPGADIADYLEACRVVGTVTYKMDALAAALQQYRARHSGNCFNCGKPGHFRAQCRAPGGGSRRQNNQAKPKTVCPRCKKGFHWAKQCRTNRPPSLGN
ncbi:PREDICTED: endogenous retrovirus group K member 9 Gag polyprotein [Thamnophis sirtalis]|uniref:Gag polyprotein n=1 Tax=Thamnophis sirtalis TaxID=35019 RepID=A0A6I9Y4C2_9SAUR|nr:PREDICTED: endogenous retrovirus group K member 9 Gag polyprotein [Thamnophis sirtalis]